MSSAMLRRFHAVLGRLDERSYLLAKVSYEAAPALFGKKPSSLVSFCSHGRNLCRLWDHYKHGICAELKLDFFELKKTEKHTLVLFYHRNMLEGIASDFANKAFLRQLGYQGALELDSFLLHLKKRLEGNFPHEIGLLLGIPREDIAGFIAGAECVLCGYWKVYHNPEAASCLFRTYDMAKTKVVRRICRMEEKDIPA